jgi:hypothetical protein
VASKPLLLCAGGESGYARGSFTSGDRAEFTRWDLGKMATRRINLYFIFSVIYMGLIFYLSSYRVEMRVSAFSSWDKLVHLVAYGILASLVYLALQEMNVGKRYLWILAFMISFLYGGLNEIHQYFVPWRQADILDAMANGIGAFCFPLGLWLKNHYKER